MLLISTLSQRGINERFDGHHGPVTGIDFHPSTGAIDFSDLFITSSTDWTCKLWNQKADTIFQILLIDSF